TIKSKWQKKTAPRQPLQHLGELLPITEYAGATFQRVMDLAFKDVKHYIAIYLDDLTVFLKKRGDHIYHLEQVLARCRKHGISLKLKKFIFGFIEGKLLGHIVNKHGAHINPDRIRYIQALALPTSNKGVHSFFGKVNFLHRFVPEFVELTKHITSMMKHQAIFKWNNEGKVAFEEIKKSIAKAPTLVSPNFNKDFIMYCYASEHTLSDVLVQKSDEDVEAHIAFMSCSLKKHEIKYIQLEKHAYAVVKTIKNF
ncbi:hypothetical protein KI387_028291, partial [Taxus chinensis]